MAKTPAVAAARHALSANGFLPQEDPLCELPGRWRYIDFFGEHIPSRLRDGSLRGVLDRLPPTSVIGLKKRGLELAMLRFSFLASAYVFANGDPEKPTLHVPEGIAIPLAQCAKILGRPPILSYASYCLANWRRIDQRKPIELQNLELIQNFRGTPDENWFVLIHVVIEKQAGELLSAIPQAQKAVVMQNNAALVANLLKIYEGLRAMYSTLLKMPKGCSPDNYWRDVRPYIFSFKNVMYEGVTEFENTPQSFRGETGAQSSIVPSLIAALRIKHDPTELIDHLRVMRQYMPPAHRRFIEAIWAGPSVPDYIVSLQSGRDKDTLGRIFNSCLDWLYKFRSLHYAYAEEYIAQKVQNPEGTGGTMFTKFLAQMRDETLKRKLPV